MLFTSLSEYNRRLVVETHFLAVVFKSIFTWLTRACTVVKHFNLRFIHAGRVNYLIKSSFFNIILVQLGSHGTGMKKCEM